jgi:hypothetical protein
MVFFFGRGSICFGDGGGLDCAMLSVWPLSLSGRQFSINAHEWGVGVLGWIEVAFRGFWLLFGFSTGAGGLLSFSISSFLCSSLACLQVCWVLGSQRAWVSIECGLGCDFVLVHIPACDSLLLLSSFVFPFLLHTDRFRY